MNQTTNDAATDKLLSLLENAAGDWTSRLATAGPLAPGIEEALRGVVRRLARSRKEFDSKLFILLVFGPLKSGKSTLVNCLVRSEVSPTALGISTTKRPCIILGSNGASPSAEQFFEASRNPNTRREAFENVIDHLRGLEDRASLATLVEVKGLDWGGVHEELRKDLRVGAREPLITALRVAENCEERFLDEGVAVIDSPGLDDPVNMDTLAHHEKTAVGWAVENADLCVLVHSSLAAPGADLLKFVAGTLTKDSAPPLVILQNRFDARLWRKAEVIEAENEKQQLDTRAKVSEALGGASQKVVFKEFHLNLGLSSDLRFKHDEVDQTRQLDLGLQDRLAEVQDEILGLVKNNREPLKRANCVNRLKEFLKADGQGLTALEQCKLAAQAVKNLHESETAELAGLVAQVQSFQHLPDGNWIVNAKVKDQEQLWAKNLIEERDKLKAHWWEAFGEGDRDLAKFNFRKQIPGDVVNKKCKKLVEDLKQQLGPQVFNRGGAFGVDLARTLTDELVRAEERLIPQTNKSLTRLRLAAVGSKPAVGPPELPDPVPVFGGFTFSELDQTCWLIFAEHYNTKEAQGQVDHVAGELQKKMESFRDSYAESVRKTAAELAKKRMQELLNHLAAEKRELERRWQPELERAENALKLVQELKEELHSLGTAANAVKSRDALRFGETPTATASRS